MSGRTRRGQGALTEFRRHAAKTGVLALDNLIQICVGYGQTFRTVIARMGLGIVPRANRDQS